MDSFVCDKCGKKFTAKTNLTRHEKTHTKENFTCGQCDGKYNTKRALQEHDTRVHSSVLYPCEQCKKSFTCKSSLKKHAKCHSNVEKTFECEYCYKAQIFSINKGSGKQAF